MAIPNTLANVPFLGGYLATKDYNENTAPAAQVSQLSGLAGLMGALQTQQAATTKIGLEKKYRDELASATTPQEQLAVATKYMGPDSLGKTLEGHLDRQAALANTKELGLARIDAAARSAQQVRDARLATANTKAEQDAIHNQYREYELGLQRERLMLGGAQAQYNIGFNPVNLPAAPSIAQSGGSAQPPESVTSGNTVLDPEVLRNPEMAAAVANINANPGVPVPLPPNLQWRTPQGVGAPTQPQAGGDAWTPPAPIVSSAAPNNLDARDLGAGSRGPVIPVPTTVVPTPGNGVPGARAALANGTPAPVMPTFLGSPREIAQAKNRWLEKQAEAALKVDANVAGGRESQQNNRIINGVTQGVKTTRQWHLQCWH